MDFAQGWAAFAAWGLLESLKYADSPVASQLANSSFVQSAKEQTIKALMADHSRKTMTKMVVLWDFMGFYGILWTFMKFMGVYGIYPLEMADIAIKMTICNGFSH